MRRQVETAGRLVAKRSVPVSGATEPYGTVDDTGRVEFPSKVLKKTGAATMAKTEIKSDEDIQSKIFQ